MTEDSMHRTLNAALARNSGPSAEDVEAQIAHRLTCDRCRMGWYCGGLSEDDYAAGARIADLLAAHTAAAKREGARAVVDGWADGWDVRPLIDRRLADARAEGARAVAERVAALADEWIAADDTTQWGDHTRSRCGRELRGLLDAREGGA